MRGLEEDVGVRLDGQEPPCPAPSPSHWGWVSLPVPLASLAVIAVWIWGPGPSRESVTVLMGLQAVSLIAGLLVAHLAAAEFRMNGALGGLFLGCGALFWSGTGLVPELVGRADADSIVALHNTLSWLSAACHLAGILVSLKPHRVERHRIRTVVLVYVAATALMCLVVQAKHAELLPTYFVEGRGGTPFRQAVLSSALLMFGLATALLGRRASRATAFGRWYALAMASVTIGLLALLFQKRIGSVLNWLGRGTQMMGGVYMLAAARAAVRDSLAAVLFVDTSLREAERRFRGLVDSAPDAIAVHQDGRIVYANSAAVRLFGGSLDDLLGREALSMVHPEDRARSAARMEQVRAGCTLPASELRSLRADGTFVHVESTVGPVLFRGRPAEQVILRNVDERRRAEDSVRRSENRLGLLARTAAHLLAALDPQKVLANICEEVMEHLDCHVFLNFLVDPSSQRLRLEASAGLSPEQVRELGGVEARLCASYLHGRQEMFPEPVALSCEGHARLLRAAGIQACCCHRLMGAGRCLGTLAFGRRTARPFTRAEVEVMNAVTDQVATALQRVEARRELREANARLLEEDRRKNEFLAVLSHELRNPLSPISNSLHVLDRAEPGSEVAIRARQVIGRQVGQLSRLVDDLLDVTRITRNKIALHLEPLDLNDVVLRAVEDNRFLFDEANVRIEVQLATQPVIVRGDRMRLTQVVGNLLHNAAKFGRPGGWTRIGLDVADRWISVCVEDDGAGMSPATLASLFQPFVQAKQTLDRSKGGLGLGLSLVKSLLEMHGGRVRATSAGLGQGSQFVLELPRHDGSVPVQAPVAAPPSTRRRVLIIEDNVDSAESLRAVLEMDQHEVSVAHNGPDGLAQARQFRPEVVLCDIGLPGMDGYDVARAFRADEELCRAYLVALSGYAAPEDVERASKAGFHRHMAKPPHMEHLSALLASA